MEKFKFKDKEGTEITAYKWIPSGEIKGVIAISHGMSESVLRYDYFAKKLNDVGLVVYAHSHRGHGETALSKELLGYVADNDGFNWLVEDVKELVSIAKDENKGLPIILFGHSMGSFVSQRFIQKHGELIDGLILSGSNGKPKPHVKLGKYIAGIEMKIKGRKAKSPLMDKLSFGDFNSWIKNPTTEYDWICGNEDAVQEYIKDEYSGFVCTTSFYYDLINGLFDIHRERNLNAIRRELPINIFAGDKDPVGYFGKGIISLYNTLQKVGVKDLNYKLYEDGRHEMLNEKNRDEVIKDTVAWITRIIDIK